MVRATGIAGGIVTEIAIGSSIVLRSHKELGQAHQDSYEWPQGHLAWVICSASSVLGYLPWVTYPWAPVLGHLGEP